jgi:cardiolipin synthase A/B
MRPAVRLARHLSAAGAALLLTACASLPDVSSLEKTPASLDAPTVSNANGILSDRKAGALLQKTWKGSASVQAEIGAVASREEAATDVPLIAGNKIDLLYDGPQTMVAMFAAIRAARHHINLETYIFDQDELGMKFADLLIERQRAGVQVNIIYDSVGTLGTPQAFFDRMAEAGVRLLVFNPVNPLKLIGPWMPNNRDHRKILIVDGTVAFAGGVNISDDYASSSLFRSRARHKTDVGWRDTHVRIEGPAVAALQTAFLQSWSSQHAAALPDNQFFPPLQNAGNKLVRVLTSGPGDDHEIYKAYLLAIQQARKTVHITNAYFVPDPEILRVLTDAAQRGVDVKIVLPGVSDSGLVLHASRSFYSAMLASGIRLYQLKVAVLHAKTAVIDKVWATVGSTNLDTRSFLHNSEVNVVVMDDEFGQAMENAFTEDLRDSVEVTAEEWEQRGAGVRLKEWLARQMAYWL